MALTWPLAAQLSSGLGGLGDPQQQAWILAWDAHALITDPGGVWQAPIMFPYPDTLAYHDHMLLLMPVAAPILWAGGSPALALNVLVLLTFALSGWAVYGLALDLGGSKAAAFVGGAAFTFCAYRFGHSAHLNLLQTMWLPWALRYQRRLLLGGRWRDGALFGLFTFLQAANVLYYAFFAAAALGGYAALWAVQALWRRARRQVPLPWNRLGKLIVCGGAAALATVPLLLPYLRLYQTLGIVRSARELDNWSAPLLAYLAAPAQNLLHRTLGLPLEGPGELVLFPGLLVTTLALCGLASHWGAHDSAPAEDSGPRTTPLDIVYLALLAAGAFVLSLGTGVRLERGGALLPIPTPYTFLYSHVPGFGAMRVPARWGVLVSLTLALLAALALARWLPRKRNWRIASAGLVLVVVLAEQIAPLPVALAQPGPVPPVYAWLGEAAQNDIQVVLELPVGKTPRGADLQRIMQRHYNSSAHWKKLPVAYGALIPFGITDLMGIVQRLPNQETLRYLQLVGVDTLVIHMGEYEPGALNRLLAGLDGSGLARRRAEVGESLVYTLLPDDALTALAQQGAGRRVYVSADERVPGVLALALSRRWHNEGFLLYGPSRVRYYGPLETPAPGAVFDYGLLAEAEDPAPYGFAATGLRWRSNGLAFYQRDPALLANLGLGKAAPGMFHPTFPASITLTAGSGTFQAGDTQVSLVGQATGEYYVELSVASLVAQDLVVGTERYPLRPGANRVLATVRGAEQVTVAGTAGLTAIERALVWATTPLPQQNPPGDALVAEVSFSESTLAVAARTSAGALQLTVQGAAAYDDRPVQLLVGELPAADGIVSFSVNLLRPEESWLSAKSQPQDGRYIAYLRAPGSSAGPGVPVATFRIVGGQLVDAAPAPLPLTLVR